LLVFLDKIDSMSKFAKIVFLMLLLSVSCKRAQTETNAVDVNQAQKNNITPVADLLEGIEVYSNTDCNKTLEEVLLNWGEQSQPYADNLVYDSHTDENQSCLWTRLKFKNTDSIAHSRILYFPKGWDHLDCYVPLGNKTYEKKSIGIRNNQEVLYVRFPPLDTTVIYIRYPEKTHSYIPTYTIREMSEQDYLIYRSRDIYKFMLLGVMLFPFLFFFTQFMVQKDKLIFYYLLFLLGSFTYLLTMLDTIPFFELSPKIMASMGSIQLLFYFSTLITFIGLVKYIHCFLDVYSWSQKLLKTGNLMLGAFFVIALIPIIHTPIIQSENYVSYLQYFRVSALLVFVYILCMSIWAVWKKIKFSRTLLLAFSPFIISGVLYATSFVLSKGYTWLSLESLVMIVGFMLTLLLFGVVLGVRNNAIKGEKLKLEQKTERLKELDHFKSRFYTNITHEFRTPLTVIKGMSSLISKNKKIKTIILRNTDRILNMINQLLDLTKLETNNLEVNWVQGDIVPYLQYLTESCHSLAENKNLNLAFFSKEENIVMDFDEDKMQHILVNLISNAIKFTPKYGSVKVIISRCFEKGISYMELAVKDTGKGIPLDKLNHIFDRFYQVDDSMTRKGEGSGIGLALVKELVQLLDGRIEVDSKLNKGSSFFVYLPILNEAKMKAMLNLSSDQDSTIDNSMVADQEVKPSVFVNKDKPLILIIEDNADVTEYIITCLNQDYQLIDAHNGKVGVEKALENIPDVILCDVMMPEMDGFEVCQKLKADIRTSHIPIILLTSKASQKDKVTGLAHGADVYLTKPFDKEELLIRLVNLASQSKRLREQLVNTVDENGKHQNSNNLEADFLDKLNKIITIHLHDELFDTIYLCKAIAMSRTQLHRKLKALTGYSTAKYIRIARLIKAKSLLETTNQNIGEIALQVGFKDFSHFSRSFSRRYGINPSETRN
jgi:signal transduction histidine kinase/DNA-binding response OmpR family regulator